MRNPFASQLWRNPSFVRVWSAASISIFGSLITRLALPFAAILVLGSGAIEVALLRAVELVAALIFGLVAGRLGRPPAHGGRSSSGRTSVGRSCSRRSRWLSRSTS